MKYKLIGCFDVLVEAFMPLQCVNDMLDEDIIESNRRAVVNGTIPADKARRLIVFKFGTFDDKTGKFEIINPVKLCNLASYLPRNETVTEEVKTDGSNN